jgi:hypothetical protein
MYCAEFALFAAHSHRHIPEAIPHKVSERIVVRRFHLRNPHKQVGYTHYKMQRRNNIAFGTTPLRRGKLEK